MTNASAATDDGIPGRSHVDLNRQRRTDSALAARFNAFADLECAPGGSGMSDERWLEALIWPEHADRTATLASAREVWLWHPPRVEAGDALERLPDLVAEAPADAALACSIATR